MNATLTAANPRLTLQADSAADLMRADPVTIAETASVREAVDLMLYKRISSLAVVNEVNKPVGVLSRTDVLDHDLSKARQAEQVPEFYSKAELHTENGEPLPAGFSVEKVDRATVRDLMTPLVYSVRPNSSAANVIEQLTTLGVHRVFVVDAAGALCGIISTLDVLRRLDAEPLDEKR